MLKLYKKVAIKKILKNQKIYYTLLVVFFISYLSIFLLQNNARYETSCEQYLVSYTEYTNLDEYLEINPMSIRGNVALIELNLLPDLNSLKCLGKSIDYTANNLNATQARATSHKFLELINFINTSVIFTLFLLFSKSSKIQFIFTILGGYFVFSYLFFGGLVFNYYFLIYPLTIFWFLILSNKTRMRLPKSKLLDLFIFININLLIFNYDLYSMLLPFIIIFYFLILKQSLEQEHIKVLSYGAIFYYFLRQLSGPVEELTYIWQNLSSSMFRGTPRFADMYYTFSVLDCNKTGCSTENNYGPLWEYLSINLNTSAITNITSIILIFTTQVFFYKFMKNNITKGTLIYFIYISPPSAFLLERMNFDIFVVIFGYFALSQYIKGNKNLCLIIVMILTLIKIFPIIFFLGIVIYEYINKEYKSILKILTLIFVNILIYFFYLYLDLQTGFIPEPSGISWTFGILTDISNFSQFFGSFGLVLYLGTLAICIIIYLNYLKIFNSVTIFSSSEWLLEISFFLCFIFISIYYNFDYRISIFSIGLILIIKNYNLKNFEIVSLLFLSTCVSRFYTFALKNTDPIDFYFSSVILIVNQITFNLVFIFLVGEVISFLKSKEVFNFYKEIRSLSK